MSCYNTLFYFFPFFFLRGKFFFFFSFLFFSFLLAFKGVFPLLGSGAYFMFRFGEKPAIA